MNHHLREREKEKTLLLEKIQQQRLELASIARNWLQITAPWDHGWQKIVSIRHYLLAATSLLTLYGIRHPRKIITWSKRLLGTWGAVQWVRRVFLSFHHDN